MFCHSEVFPDFELQIICLLLFFIQKGDKDVLVATDVASKGLDFPGIQHVINYDMPDDIENYVHRIGRTGRSGQQGVATTFVNKANDESVLLDLKHLLIEAKQKVSVLFLPKISELIIIIYINTHLKTLRSRYWLVFLLDYMVKTI